MKYVIYALSFLMLLCGALLHGALLYEFIDGEYTQGAFIKRWWKQELYSTFVVFMGLMCYRFGYEVGKLKDKKNASWDLSRLSETRTRVSKIRYDIIEKRKAGKP